jgi:hypothetical protein
MREIVAAQESSLAPGWYLFGADAPALTMTFAQLSEAVPALAGRAASRNRTRQDGAR